MSAVGSQSVSTRGTTDDAFSKRASHASISTLDVRTGRLQWRTALHGRWHHKIEYTLEASLRQMRPRRLGGHDLSAGRLPAYWCHRTWRLLYLRLLRAGRTLAGQRRQSLNTGDRMERGAVGLLSEFTVAPHAGLDQGLRIGWVLPWPFFIDAQVPEKAITTLTRGFPLSSVSSCTFTRIITSGFFARAFAHWCSIISNFSVSVSIRCINIFLSLSENSVHLSRGQHRIRTWSPNDCKRLPFRPLAV